MYTEEDIESAVKAGVIDQETADAFRRHVAEQQHTHIVDEEQFRLITGFNDIFVVIACSLLLGAIAWIGNHAATWLGAAVTAIAAWGLGEFFIRKRRMALPAIVLLLVFVISVFFAAKSLMPFDGFSESVASIIAAIAAYLHWKRFHVPITIAAGAGAVAGCIVTGIFYFIPESTDWLRIIVFIAGVSIFAFAMWWDMSDRLRQTRRSDVAFWLHLLAAPMLVHPVFTALDIFSGKSTLIPVIIVLVLYALIAFISVLIDRRALMVSSLAYVIYASGSLLKAFGMVDIGFAFTALVIGGALLLLSAFWHPSRVLVLQLIPKKITGHLPPL